MRLQMDLVRDLLLYIEENAKRPVDDLEDISLPNWREDDIAYHVVLLEEAGLVAATINTIPDSDDPSLVEVLYSVRRLTFNGHEFLNTVREPEQWGIVKEGAKKAGAYTLGAIARIAEAYVSMKINSVLGISGGA